MRKNKFGCALICTTALLAALNVTPIGTTAMTVPHIGMVSAATVPGYGNQVESANWDVTVKTDINDFLKLYGNQSASYDWQNHPYAVFDFDNTSSILDIEEQLMIWQLNRLAFAITPDQLQSVLETGIPKDKLAMTYGADDGAGRQVRIDDAIHDAVAAYTVLYQQGAVTLKGKEPSAAVRNSAEYQDFRAKMRWLYDAISETMDASVSYPWVTYWFTGMTPQQVYNLAYESHDYYSNPEKGQTWTKGQYQSPPALQSRAGSVTIAYKNGITVTPEIKELYGALKRNGFDNWINSASQLDVVRAAVDCFSIPGIKGIVAMTNKLDANGKYTNAYDYDLHAQTQGVGKSQTIMKVLMPKYKGHGPSFCAMDSQGDFNFSTEFKDTKAVLILNRQRKDDAAICAGVAVWQKEHHQTVQMANESGNTKYILQGRNENTGRFWADDHTLLLGKTTKAYLSPKAENTIKQLNEGMTIAEVFKKDTKLKDYQGYKSR